jgi:hypothetical protein
MGRNVTDSDVSAGCTSSERNIGAVVDDHGNRQRYECARRDEHVARIQILESKLDHRRTAAHRRGGTLAESVNAVAKVVGDGDQP